MTLRKISIFFLVSIFWFLYNWGGLPHNKITTLSECRWLPVRIQKKSWIEWRMTFRAHSTPGFYSSNFFRLSTHLKAIWFTITANVSPFPVPLNPTPPKFLPLEYCDEANSMLLESHQKWSYCHPHHGQTAQWREKSRPHWSPRLNERCRWWERKPWPVSSHLPPK